MVLLFWGLPGPARSASGADEGVHLGIPAQSDPVGQNTGEPPAAPLPCRDRAAGQSRYDHGEPTDSEQYMLELVNEARAHPVETASELGIGLNDEIPDYATIGTAPKPPLAFNPELIAAARTHSQWMLDEDIFSHTGENDSAPGDRMSAAGYPFSPPYRWAENLAWSGSTTSVDLTQFVLDEHEGLFRSPGHRINMMEPSFEEIGIGVKQGKFRAQTQTGTWYNFDAVMATQNFAVSTGTPGPFITGVVFIDRDKDGFYSPGEGVAGATLRPSRGLHYAVTSTSGGYAIPFRRNTGPLILAFEIPGFPVEIKRKIDAGTLNTKCSLNLSELSPSFVAHTIHCTANNHFSCDVAGPFDRDVQVVWSDDFVDWNPSAKLHLPDGTATFVDPSTKKQKRYYRLEIVQ